VPPGDGDRLHPGRRRRDGDLPAVGPDGLAEDRIIRGLHPLTAQRLNLWRLKNFDGERVPSAEDTYLFHVTAKDNPNDERFIAMAEVRDLTPLRDEAGEIVGFPTVERQLTACLDGLRRAQSQRRSRRPLEHNRVYLYAWPSIEVPLSEVATFARTAAPLTVGAGWTRSCCWRGCRRRRRAPRRGAALLLPAGHRRAHAGHRPADRADAPAGRVHREGAELPGPRRGLPVRAGPAAGRPRRLVRRARPRRARPAGAGRAAARAATGRHRRRAWSARRRSATRRA
jgi:hypothetical protein